MRAFYSSLIVTIVGILLGAGVGYMINPTLQGVLSALFLIVVLSILEVSLSFDNAVVNAHVLNRMTPLWRKRFLTWGMLIAVFGMRLVFPLLIVVILAKVGPIDALILAATKPHEYAQMMLSIHHLVAAFGGAFLIMVSAEHFFNKDKDVHWIHLVESPLSKLGAIPFIGAGLALAFIVGFSFLQKPQHFSDFLVSGIAGLLTFLAVDWLSSRLGGMEDSMANAEKASFGLFLYLEVLDASFSFDGVVGAFAITENLFIICIGLGIGAMFVRSMTIYLVDKGTLTQYRYLEHGAFYAIGALGLIMFCNTIVPIPEVITGLLGAAFIGLSFWSSLQHKKKTGEV